MPQHEKIKVRVLEIRPQPTTRTKLEQVTWDLTLAPGEQRQIEWRCAVESPAETETIGLP
jgi:hypothetical protein